MSGILNGLGSPIQAVSDPAGPFSYRNGLPFSAGKLAISGDLPDHYHQGLGFTAAGLLCVGDGPVTHWQSGAAPVNALGQLVVGAGPVTHYTHGVPYSADGGVVMDGTQNGEAQLVFHAASYDPDTFELQQESVGVGGETCTHTAEIYSPNKDGVYHAFPANAPVWEGARSFNNQLVAPNDFSDAIWGLINNCAKVGVASGVGPSGEDCMEVSFPQTNSRIRQSLTYAGKALFSIWVKPVDGLPTTVILRESGHVGTTISLDGAWQRIVYGRVNDTPGTENAVSSSGAGTSNLYLFQSMHEVVAGRSDLLTPSEYTEMPRSQANANGNSVASGVVTEAAGTPLLEAPWLVYQPAATNAQIQSNDLTDVEWTATNATVSKDEVGIDGVANSACRVTATSNTATVIGNVIAAASDTHAGCFYIKRAVGAAACEITVDGGVTWEPMTLSTEFEKFTIEKLDASQLGIRLGFSGDSIVVGNAEFHAGKTIAEVRDLGPIFTTTTAISTDETINTWAAANHSDVGDSYEADYKLSGEDQVLISMGGVPFLFTEGQAGGTNLISGTTWTRQDSAGSVSTISNNTASTLTLDVTTGSTSYPVTHISSPSSATDENYYLIFNAHIVSGTPKISRLYNGVAYSMEYTISEGENRIPFGSGNGSYTLFMISWGSPETAAFHIEVTNIKVVEELAAKQVTLTDGTNSCSTPVVSAEPHIKATYNATDGMTLDVDGVTATSAYDGTLGSGDLSTKATQRDLIRRGS